MASKACATCLGAIQRQSRRAAMSRKSPLNFTSPRAFTTTRQCAAAAPKDNPASRKSKPVATTKNTEAGVQDPPPSTAKRIAKAAVQSKKFSGITASYTAFGATEVLYKECSGHADYTIPQAADSDAEIPKTEDEEDLGIGEGWWHTELGLKPTFSTWSQVTMLYMYFLSARLRCLPPETAKMWQQQLTDHFFYEAEEKMVVNHGMNARGTRNKYLKDLFLQWRGVLAAYDEGVAKNDAVLAAAVWRNIFKAREDVDVKALAAVVSFMRRALKGMDELDDAEFLTTSLSFGSPEIDDELVAIKSGMMKIPLSGKSVPSAMKGKR